MFLAIKQLKYSITLQKLVMGGNGISQLLDKNYTSIGSRAEWEQNIISKYNLQSKTNRDNKENMYEISDVVFESLNVTKDMTNSSNNKQYILKTLNLPQCSQVCSLLKNSSKTLKYKNILNIVETRQFSEGNFCNSSHSVFALFQYAGIYSLEEQIKARSKDQAHFSIPELLRIYKFIVNILKEIKHNGYLWFPIVSPEDIILNEDNGNMKYKNPVQTTYFSTKQKFPYYCPQNWGRVHKQSESIFSFGISMISACLLENLSDCYDLKNYKLCVSLLQERIQTLRSLHSTYAWSSFCDILQSMVQLNSIERPTIQECSIMCNDMLSRLRKEENQRTQILSDISTTYNNNGLERTLNPITQRSHKKNSNKLDYKKNSCDFSSGKYKTNKDRWEIESSGKKDFEINGSLNKKILLWKNDYEKENEMQEMPFQSIDKKWKEKQQIFQKMPQFDEIDQSFHFEIDSKVLGKADYSLKSYRC